MDFDIAFAQRDYLVNAVRITTDTNHSTIWEEIDAVQLRTGVEIDATPPTADLMDPADAGVISQTTLNGRKYIDVTFADTGGSGLDPSSITDSGTEFTLTGAAASGVTLDGAATLVSGNTYRYSFTGDFAPGLVTVGFSGGTFADSPPEPKVAGSNPAVAEGGRNRAGPPRLIGRRKGIFRVKTTHQQGERNCTRWPTPKQVKHRPENRSFPDANAATPYPARKLCTGSPELPCQNQNPVNPCRQEVFDRSFLRHEPTPAGGAAGKPNDH